MFGPSVVKSPGDEPQSGEFHVRVPNVEEGTPNSTFENTKETVRVVRAHFSIIRYTPSHAMPSTATTAPMMVRALGRSFSKT